MNKIDLSLAQPGDEFSTFGTFKAVFVGPNPNPIVAGNSYPYLMALWQGKTHCGEHTYSRQGAYVNNQPHSYNLKEKIMGAIMNNKIDLNTCKPGDKCISKGGRTFIYKTKDNHTPGYPHTIMVIDECDLEPWAGTFTDDGIFCLAEPDNNRNIVKIEHVESQDIFTQAGFKMPRQSLRRDDRRGAEYGYYLTHDHPINCGQSQLVTRYDNADRKRWTVEVDNVQFVEFMADQP